LSYNFDNPYYWQHDYLYPLTFINRALNLVYTIKINQASRWLYEYFTKNKHIKILRGGNERASERLCFTPNIQHFTFTVQLSQFNELSHLFWSNKGKLPEDNFCSLHTHVRSMCKLTYFLSLLFSTKFPFLIARRVNVWTLQLTESLHKSLLMLRCLYACTLYGGKCQVAIRWWWWWLWWWMKMEALLLGNVNQILIFQGVLYNYTLFDVGWLPKQQHQ